MDVINCLALLTNQLTGPPARADQDLERYRQILREQIEKAPRSPVEGLAFAQDGVIYKDGYRVEKFDDTKLDQLNVRIKELERRSQEKDQTLDRLNIKLQELERKSVERDLVITEIRSRSVSRRESPEPFSNSPQNIPQIILGNDEPRQGSSKFRPIHRDDEFRRTIKKRSLTSNVSDDRSDELEALSQMEEDEAKQMEDYVPLVYDRDEYPDSKTKKHMISPIQELCHMHEEEHRSHMTLERSPEPSFGADITKPWGDIKLEETKGKTLIHPARDLCIQEELRDSESSAPEEEECVAKHIEQTQQWIQTSRNTLPELPQLNADLLLATSESVPSNLSSHSNSPDPEHPTLKRTRKKSDLTALLQEEERRNEAFTTIIIQTEESDSEGVARTGFMQSRSPSPYVGPFEDDDSQKSTGQLIPLVDEPSSKKSSTPADHDQQQSSLSSLPLIHSRDATISPAPFASSRTSSPYVGPSAEDDSQKSTGHLLPPAHEPTSTKSPTPIDHDQQQSSLSSLPSIHSRDATISPAPIASSGSPASPVSSIVDELAKDGPPQLDIGDRSSPALSEKNLIFSGEYTKAMSKDWHSGHFCCWQCDESLTGQRYVLRDEHPYCIKCYENVFANVCEECNKTIGIDSKDLSYKDKHWHEACFLCNKCRISLVDKQFGSKADKIYCGNCYDAQFASRCDGCGEIFRAGTKKMEYKTRQWHEKCFCCCVCKTAIGTKSFIPREQEIYCAGCYEEKYATRCIKCKKIITSGGVTYKNEPWHRECFTCTHCQVSLAGQRFTSRDEKPYCAECFGELFAKRCTACVKPITGIGGTRFISFEDRHWHNDCFICAMCKTSLVGRGFITDEQDVICPECAKQKLM